MGYKAKAFFLIAVSAVLISAITIILLPYFGDWSLSVAVGITTIVMWPILQHYLGKYRYFGIFYKLDSKKGLKLIDHLGTKYSRFWKFVGNSALVLIFGGLGTAFVSDYLTKKQRRLFVSLLAFLVVFVYASQTTAGLSGIHSKQPLWGASLGAPVLLLAYYLFSEKGRPSLLAFVLGFLLFSSPYVMAYSATNNAYDLIFAVAMGIVGVPGILIVILLLAGMWFAFGLTQQSAIYPALPAVEDGIPVLKAPGDVGVSIPIFPDILLAFIAMLVLHEMFHGLVARAHGIRLKHTGLLITSIIPMGAFVEPDEEQFKKESEEKQARVMAVGSFANLFVVAPICFYIGALLLATGAVYPDGIEADTVVVNSTASRFIEFGDIIRSIDGKNVLSNNDFFDIMTKTKPNQTVDVLTSRGLFTVQLGRHPEKPERGYLGLAPKCDATLGSSVLASFSPDLYCSHLQGGVSLSAFHILKWVFLMNIAVGIFNLLPIPLLDGYGVYNQIFSRIEKKSRRKNLKRILLNGFAFLIAIILLLNILPYFAKTWGELAILAISMAAFILIRSKFRRSSSRKSKKI